MKRKVLLLTLLVVLPLTLLASVLLAQGRGQGRGNGYGRGRGMGYGMGNGMCRMNSGNSADMAGVGGWWTRVTPKTTEQRTFVTKVTGLHEQIRTTNVELASLQAGNASAAKIADKQKALFTLRTELQKVTTANSALFKQMGVPAGMGVCDGTGPKGACNGYCQTPGMDCANCPYAGTYGQGNGFGRGNGMRLRNGSGPNLNCPLK